MSDILERFSEALGHTHPKYGEWEYEFLYPGYLCYSRPDGLMVTADYEEDEALLVVQLQHNEDGILGGRDVRFAVEPDEHLTSLGDLVFAALKDCLDNPDALRDEE